MRLNQAMELLFSNFKRCHFISDRDKKKNPQLLDMGESPGEREETWLHMASLGSFFNFIFYFNPLQKALAQISCAPHQRRSGGGPSVTHPGLAGLNA